MAFLSHHFDCLVGEQVAEHCIDLPFREWNIEEHLGFLAPHVEVDKPGTGLVDIDDRRLVIYLGPGTRSLAPPAGEHGNGSQDESHDYQENTEEAKVFHATPFLCGCSNPSWMVLRA